MGEAIKDNVAWSADDAVDSEIEQLINEAEGVDVAEEWEPVDAGGEPKKGMVKIDNAEMLGQLLYLTFGLIAAKKGEHWSLSEGEATEAGSAYAAVLEKHSPKLVMGPEITAVLVTVTLIAPRIAVDHVINAKRVEKEVADDGE